MKLPALLMAGGEGKRLGINGEKPMVDFEGRPMVDKVLDALVGSQSISQVFVAVSQKTPLTDAHVREREEFRKGKITITRTPGQGYVEDMLYVFNELGLRRAFITSSDLPLLTPGDVDYVVEEYRARGARGSMTVLVPMSLVVELGFTPNYPSGESAASGVNIVDIDDAWKSDLITKRASFAANINNPYDLEIAKRLRKI